MSFTQSLQHSGFRRLWEAEIVSGFGDRIHEIALLYIVFVQTENPLLVAAVGLASIVPTTLLSAPAGSLVDRANRRNVLVVVSLIRGCAVLAVPIAIWYGNLVPVVLAVAFVTGAAQAFAGPARSSLIPNLVPAGQLDSANGLMQLTSSLLRLMYAFGGIVIALLGVELAFYIDIASFFLAAVVLYRIDGESGRVSRDDQTSSLREDIRNIKPDVVDGVRFVARDRILPSLVLLSGLTAFALAPLGVVIPFYTRAIQSGTSAVLSSTASEFGMLYALLYLGILVGAVLVNGVKDIVAEYRGKTIIGGVFFAGSSLAMLGFIPSLTERVLVGAGIALVLTGIGISFVQVPVSTLAQTIVPDHKRGKTFAILSVPALVAPPISIALAAPLIGRYGAPAVFELMGGLVCIVALVLLTTPLFGEAGQPDGQPAD